MLPEPPRLLLKVCGLREPANAAAVARLRPDFIGFVFHRASVRYAPSALSGAAARALPGGPARVGVFVDETPATMQATATAYELDFVQLHGHETPAICAEMQAAGLRVIKAFSVDESLDIKVLESFVPHVNYFLFDTKGQAPGGNGVAFDWQILRAYDLPVPYLLAGGIGPEHAAELARLRLPGLAGVDVNSRFEVRPGCKDVAALGAFQQALDFTSPASVAPSNTLHL